MQILGFGAVSVSQVIQSQESQEEEIRTMKGARLVKLQHQHLPNLPFLSRLPRQTPLPSPALESLLLPYQGQSRVFGCQENPGRHHIACSWSAAELDMGFSGSESEVVKGGNRWGKKRWVWMWMHNLSSVCITFISSAFSDFSSFCTECGASEGLIMTDICKRGCVRTRKSEPRDQARPCPCPALSPIARLGHTLDTHLLIILIPNLAIDSLQREGNAGILNKELRLHFLVVKL